MLLNKYMKFWTTLKFFQKKFEVKLFISDGELKGVTGKNLKNLIVVGIGGSYLSIEFVYESLRNKY